MSQEPPSPALGYVFGYARISTSHQSTDQQLDALTAAGVEPGNVFSDVLTGTSTKEQRPGLSDLLGHVRTGDVIVVIGIDRLGRNMAEVATTIRELWNKGIVIRSLREGVDSSTAVGRAVFGIMASMAELELELQRERRASALAARKARDLPMGRPKKLTDEQVRQAETLRAAGEPVPSIAKTLGVGRSTLYRVLSDEAAS